MAEDVRVRVAGRSFGYQGETYEHDDELIVDVETAFKHQRTLDVIDDDPHNEREDDEICGAEMSSGEICERPADDCPYHGE